MTSPHKTALAALNAICVEVGGVGGHTTMIAALNEWATLSGGAAGHTRTIAALNELAGEAGAVTTSVYDLDALNAIAVALEGDGGNADYLSALLDILGAVGGDITAPALSNFELTATSDTEVDVSIDTDESGGTIYYVLTENANEPNAEQVVAGLDGAFNAAAFAGSISSPTAGTEEDAATGLEQLTTYYGFAAHVDAAGNVSAVLSADAPATTEAEEGGGGRPAWLPEWADSGVSYVEGEAYFEDTLITDLSTIHGEAFDPAAVTASGMAVTELNSNRPGAIGDFLARQAQLDFTFMVHFDTGDTIPAIGVVILNYAPATGDGLAVEWGGGVGNMNVTDFVNGSFNTIGTITANGEFKVCGANTEDGWLSSVNGATAVLDTPQSTVVPTTRSLIGWEGTLEAAGNIFGGNIREIFFGPVTDVAAQIEARATL